MTDMARLLDTLGPAVWRASWQAAVLAMLVAALGWCLGERLSPRWRFLLWGVVLARLLVVATPASPWSAFNLAGGAPGQPSPTAPQEPGARLDTVPPASATKVLRDETGTGSPVKSDPDPGFASPGTIAAEAASAPPDAPTATSASVEGRLEAGSMMRILSWLWLAGCGLMALKLLATALVLRRRLGACRPVTDPAILQLWEALRSRFALQRAAALRVTPESVSPCVVGTWSPKILLPESVVTAFSTARLSHVLAHELAHLARGDLWTNWLLLAARILHWFNPVAWWTVRQMRAESEAACDERALDVLGEMDRSAYASTIVEMAASLAPTGVVPGMVGLFSSTRRLERRIERLLRSPSRLRAPVAAGLLLAVALFGLTDAMPGAEKQTIRAGAPASSDGTADTYAIRGRCLNHSDGTALAGVLVRLYRAEGRTLPVAEVGKTVTDADGRFTFTGLVPPRPESHLDRLEYAVVAESEGRPIGTGFDALRPEGQPGLEVRMASEEATLAGKVIDSAGRPVAGAIVMPSFIFRRPFPGLLSATTDADGRFRITRMPVYRRPGGASPSTSITVLHPEYPETSLNQVGLPADVTVALPAGCQLSGTVVDGMTGKPAPGALVTARQFDPWGQSYASTDSKGAYRLVVAEGRYDLLVDAKDRVCVALTGIECLAGETVDVPPRKLVAGGFISGRVVNTVTGEPVAVSDRGEPITLGLFGPSRPRGKVISTFPMATVDKTGRFTLRAAPGENFPYFENFGGQRMSWDTHKQPPVIVKEGETTHYDMLVTPEVSPEERLKAARKLVERLPKTPSERTAQILVEFRKLNRTVDETERWCLLMRELVAVGREAVPPLCDELDRTAENGMLRRLGFALRAIGDPRAVPALIRAIPRTVLPSSSDFGLRVGDKELTQFMQKHDLSPGGRGTYFDFGRPVREIFGALHRLTGQDLADAELFSISLSENPRQQVLQRRIFRRQAERWQAWWEANWRRLTDDAAYAKVRLELTDEPLPPASQVLGPRARLGDGMLQAVLSPPVQAGQHAWHFYDLDTGYRPAWPASIPRSAASQDSRQLADWATERGVDLMCVTRRSPDGTETYVLRAMGMKVREIGDRDVRNLDRLIAAGKLPDGRPVGDLLMHYDAQSQRLVPDANAAFLFVTAEGSMGLIEVTDRVTRTADLTGLPSMPTPGVGFHKGVRFNLKPIIP